MKLIMVKVVFEYFVQYFKRGESESYTSYDQKYMVVKAFKDTYNSYYHILEVCRKTIEKDFDPTSSDIDDDGKKFNVDITYDFNRLVSYEILEEEFQGAIN